MSTRELRSRLIGTRSYDAQVVSVELASINDCVALARTSKLAFDSDVDFGAPVPGGPPGYDSARWYQSAMRRGSLFRVIDDGEIVGGVLVFRKTSNCYELARIWLAPAATGQGIGGDVMRQVEELFPQAERWILDTPIWNTRTRHFYDSFGYQEYRRDREFLYLEKRTD